MRNMIGYVGAAVACALLATVLISWNIGDAFVVRALTFPDAVGAVLPDLAIQGRRFARLQSGAGPFTAIPLIALGACLFHLVMNLGALILYRAADHAWHAEPLWETGKPAWCAAIFAVMTSATFLVLELAGGPFVYLHLDPLGIAVCAAFGGFAFGLVQPKNLRRAWTPPAAATNVVTVRKANRALTR
ncbi:hypothetical protein EYW49_03280 [Siculibacillus lacustris]|uniref:Uncharacterized protein n=1 Tax=Siculibacillus lacustris TaxID=1549641 RepID=A0A4Q9VWP8_9HYPH|nr:hypothetical protein [Siculibacillus lacustris]TBW40760.1 hypothetical protein EYW49_03280 [Siculibacillus lacustris]